MASVWKDTYKNYFVTKECHLSNLILDDVQNIWKTHNFFIVVDIGC
jgi:plasmid replication initiation protein